jgi:hypothetical protein
VQVLSFVPLANCATVNKITDEPVEMSVEEGCSQPVQGLGTLMTRIMGLMEQLQPQRL